MNSLHELRKKIKGELNLREEDEELDDPSDSDIDDEPVAPGVILRVNNRSKINANIKNLEFEVYYTELSDKLSNNKNIGFTFTREKAREAFEVFLKEIGFFDIVEDKEGEESEEE